MEDVRLERDAPECAEIEDIRVRHSEYVNMNAVNLQNKLREIPGLNAFSLPDGTPLSATSLPPEVIEALLRYIEAEEAETAEFQKSEAAYTAQREHDEARIAVLGEKIERVKSEVVYLSERSSADFQEFRNAMRQSEAAAKERTRFLADITRKREKAEMDARRLDIEMERLRSIGKRARC